MICRIGRCKDGKSYSLGRSLNANKESQHYVRASGCRRRRTRPKPAQGGNNGHNFITRPPTPIVQLSYRYRAAWGEIGTRIAQRQNALQIYVTLATGILAVIFTGRPLQLDNAGHKINPNVFFFLLPIVSLTFAFLNFKHERTIAILRQFLTACETVNNSHSNPLPNYHGDEKYYKSAKRVRNWHDYASILLIIVFNAIGGWVASEAFPQLATVTWPNLLLSGLYDVMVLSACLLVGLQPSED